MACAAALTLGAAAAQAPAAPSAAPPPPPITIKQVKPGFYMVTGAGGNVEVRVGTDGLIVVDTKLAAPASNYTDLIAQIKTVSALPIKHVVNTHVHADHTGNNDKFIAAGAPVIAHENLPKLIDAMPAPANNAPKPAKPTQTYKDKLELKIPGATAVLYHFAPAHTGGDTVVYFPDLKTVAMGDELVTNGMLNFDFANGGSVAGMIQSYDATLKLDFDTVIPGHGDNPVTRADMQAIRAKAATFLDRAKAAVKAGATKETLMSQIKIDDLGWTLNPAQWGAGSPRIDGLYKEAGGK
jgi:glyoxylase-like metal-dependent hydrolase (beta-lactamase superfamily II)